MQQLLGIYMVLEPRADGAHARQREGSSWPALPASTGACKLSVAHKGPLFSGLQCMKLQWKLQAFQSNACAVCQPLHARVLLPQPWLPPAGGGTPLGGAAATFRRIAQGASASQR